MPASELIERVADLIAASHGDVPPDVRPQLDGLSGRLREPLRVAVVGRVKAGKSTLVNALLGQRVAPTDVSECTRVVTWFRYGHPERVTCVLRDGTTVDTQLTPDGMLPALLPAPVEEVASLQTYLANEQLRDMTLIDTPGIGSVHGEYSGSTEDLLRSGNDSATAAGAADAIVFCLNQVMMQDELATLQLFRSPSGEDGPASAANAVGVLGRADQLGDGTRDSFQIALELAGRYEHRFANEVASIVPVIGLLAQTAETAGVTEYDARDIITLAQMDERAFKRMLWSVDRFISVDAPLPPDRRKRLLEMLDLYGIDRAVASVREGADGAVALRRQLADASGVAGVKRLLNTYFREQDHVLKVRSALDVLRRLSYADQSGPGAARLRSRVEQLRLDPSMHAIQELELLHDCAVGTIAMPDDKLAEIRTLMAPGNAATKLGLATDDKAALIEQAKSGMIGWRRFMVSEATPTQAAAARVVMRSYQLIWEGLR